jgi:hypothetical protein
MRSPPSDFGAPSAPRRLNWVALGVSLAIHALLGLVVIRGYLPEFARRAPMLVALPPRPDQERSSIVPFYVPQVEHGRGTRLRPQPPPEPLPQPRDTLVPRPLAQAPVDTVPVRHEPSPLAGPELGDGRLWVRPLPLPPRELAARLHPSHTELVDSAVHAIIQAYLDSIAIEPQSQEAEMPSWVTEVQGKKFGLDSRNIYIAGLKIPAAVLALLPLPAGGNQQSALDHNGQVIMEDLRRAATRSNNLAEFKDAIRRLRERKQQEKDFERAQRENPDSIAVKPDSGTP